MTDAPDGCPVHREAVPLPDGQLPVPHREHIERAGAKVVASMGPTADTRCMSEPTTSTPTSKRQPITATHPELLAAGWAYPENEAAGLDPNKLTAGSSKRAWRRCPDCGGAHQTRIRSWLDKGTVLRCPDSVKDNLTVTRPDVLAAEWAYPENEAAGLDPNKLTAGSSKWAWRRCPDCGEIHETRIYGWLGRGMTPRCPNCVKNNLTITHPDVLAAEWLYPENEAEGLNPNKLTAASNKKAWRRCPDCGGAHQTYIHTWFGKGRGARCPEPLTVTHPDVVAAEWPYAENEAEGLNPARLTTGSNKTAWRRPTCCGIAHQIPIVQWFNRTKPAVCPCSHQKWTVARSKRFIEGLLSHVDDLSPAERWVIAEQSGILGSRARRDAARRVLSGHGTPADMAVLTSETAEPGEEACEDWTPGRADDTEGSAATDDSETTATDPIDRLPTSTVGKALSGLNASIEMLAANEDAEIVQFLMNSAVGKLWSAAFADEANTVTGARAALADSPSQYQREALDRFLDEHTHAKSLDLPDGWCFAKGDPNLMQWHVASQVLRHRRVGNWSQAGTGKTLSAVLASRLINAGLTMVICPNAVAGRDEVSGWAAAIQQMLGADHVDIHVGSLSPTWPNRPSTSEEGVQKPRFLIVHQDVFGRPDAAEEIDALLAATSVDMVIADEVHFLKQRGDTAASRRRTNVLHLLDGAARKSPDLAVLAMTATPVVNELSEAVSVLSLVTGRPEADLGAAATPKGRGAKATVSACMAVHQRLVEVGTRLRQHDAFPFTITRPPVDATDCLEALLDAKIGKGAHPAHVERILTEARLPAIVEACQPGPTLLYTEYIGDGIEEMLTKALTDAGLRVARQTGTHKEIEAFKNGDADVLIGTSAVGTGVDGLQDVAHRLVVNALPWTSAAWEQLVARLARTGQRQTVEVVLPETFIETEQGRWSWCEGRWERIANKQTIADAAVDGNIPAVDRLESPKQITEALLRWLDRLDSTAPVEAA